MSANPKQHRKTPRAPLTALQRGRMPTSCMQRRLLGKITAADTSCKCHVQKQPVEEQAARLHADSPQKYGPKIAAVICHARQCLPALANVQLQPACMHMPITQPCTDIPIVTLG